MKLRSMSDIHMEVWPDRGASLIEGLEDVGEDVLVLAGDITSFKFLDQALKDLLLWEKRFPGKPKVLVPGNHEFWHTTGPVATLGVIAGLNDRLPKHFRILDCSMVEFFGKRFLGGTMWYGNEDGLDQLFEKHFPDFHIIPQFVPWVYERHRLFLKFLDENLKEGDIVVTHHAPSYRSVQERYQGRIDNRFYVSDRAKEIAARRPALWFHGHMHQFAWYPLGDTQVVCNARGYPHEDGRIAFRPNLVVDIP
jgi:predicted phosphohydrolase